MMGYAPNLPVETPGSLWSALERLAQGAIRPLAGGTDLMVVLGGGRSQDPAYLDLSGIQELQTIELREDWLWIGAGCTYRDVQDAPSIHTHFPNLVKSARATGAHAIQNRGTLGGNIANASPAADTPPALLAYGADLELASVRGTRRLPYAAFHQGYKQMDLQADELITRIGLPLPQGRTVHYYRKVGTRAAQAISKTCLAGFAQVDQGTVVEIRLGVGAVAPVPLRLERTEAILRGASLQALPIAEARACLLEEIAPIDDIRSTAHYRRTVTANLLEDLLRTLSRA